jgi:integrase
LAFQILTAARTGEVIGATHSEFDLVAGTWTVPGARMKAGRDHRVPLSRQARALIRDVDVLPGTSYVFSGLREGRPLSNMSMLQLLKRMGRANITPHGFRSTFRDWASETTDHPREVAEMALAHTVSDKVEAAYRRGDLFLKRRQLMQEWANHCIPEASDVNEPVERAAV